MPQMPRPFAAPLAALLLAPLSAFAADCTGLASVETPATLQEVDGRNGPVFFVRGSSDRPECPNDSAACRAAVSMPSGSRVVVGETNGPWACASHADRSGQITSGWVPTAALTPVPDTTPTRVTDWAGRWRDAAGRSIRLTTTREGAVLMRAEADSGDRSRRARGASVTAQFTPENATATFTLAADGSTRPDSPGESALCRMALQRRGDYLIVQDNARCSGTSFTGLYQTRRWTRPAGTAP